MADDKTISISINNAAAIAKVQALPCTIHYNGEANLQHYFEPTKRNDEALPDVQHASIRGRPISSKTVTLPANTHGYVLQQIVDGEDHQFETQNSFTEIVNWKLGNSAEGEKEINGALEWISIAQAVCYYNLWCYESGLILYFVTHGNRFMLQFQ